MKRFAPLLGMLALGCTADLTPVHTPDLLEVKGRRARGFAGASSTFPWPAVEWSQCHTTLVPKEALHDGSFETVARAADPSSKDQYILIDLGCVRAIAEVVQFHGEESGFPRKYRIDVAGAHNFPYELCFDGCGTPGQSIARLGPKPVACRFIRIMLLEPGDEPWNVSELEVR